MPSPLRALVAGLLLSAAAPCQPGSMFEPKQIEVDGTVYRYRLLSPPKLEEGQRYPLVVFLHGAGERGDDNERQLLLMPLAMAEPRARAAMPCYLLALQCPTDRQWVEVPWDEVASRSLPQEPSEPLRAVMAAMERTWSENAVDRDRVYLTGLSMGGYGTYDMLARRPEWFAGVVAVCGGGDERVAHRFADVPMWIWHGAADPVVPAQRSRNMAAALRALDAPVSYTELPSVQHDSWRQAYGEGGALPWLFRQDRRKQGRSETPPPGLVPWPREIRIAPGEWWTLVGAEVTAPAALSAHARVLERELDLVLGDAADADERASVVLAMDEQLGEEEYRLEITAEGAHVAGGSPEAVARGTATLLQTLERREGAWRAPVLSVHDRPSFGYRAVMVDCARHFQSVEVLRQVVDLCRAYKVRYLQLHLTDDQSFTFPSVAFSRAATPDRHYSLEELVELGEYAAARGVAVVPELDVPGHSSALIRAYPEVFGLADRQKNGGLVNMGRQACYEGLATLVGELCEVFPHSPWIHVGGDEAWLEGVAEDPEAATYMREHGLDGPRELYHHFLQRMHEMVAARGRRTLMWEGFSRNSTVRIPRDVTVIAWESAYYRPDQLVADGYSIVNASWQPLYVVGGGKAPPHAAPKMWSAEHLLGWHPRRFEHFAPGYPTFGGMELGSDAPVLGAQMCVWEQLQHTTVEHLRSRLPAFAERLWNPEAGRGYADFRRRWLSADARFRALAAPVTVLPRPVGTLPAVGFEVRASVAMVSLQRGEIRYTLDGSEPGPRSAVYSEPFEVDRGVLVRARQYGPDGAPLGGPDWAVLQKEGPHRVRYSWYRAPVRGWKTVPDFTGMEPFATGTQAELRGGPRSLPMGIVLESTLRIPAGGEYALRLESCDGPARLLLDGELVCDHAEWGDWTGAAGKVRLEAGDHVLRIESAQGFFHTLLRVFYRGPGMEGEKPIDGLLRLR